MSVRIESEHDKLIFTAARADASRYIESAAAKVEGKELSVAIVGVHRAAVAALIRQHGPEGVADWLCAQAAQIRAAND